MNNTLTLTLKKLVLLLSIFFIGILLLISIHLVFLKLIERLDKKTDNLKAKIQLGEYIVTDLYKIRADFYELATTTSNEKGRVLILDKISHRIGVIRDILDVLEHGGQFTREIKLNITGHLKTTKTIFFENNSKNISLETIDIGPKIEELVQMTQMLNHLVQKRDSFLELNDKEKYFEYSREIKRFYKTTPAYFTRMSENTSRLLYEGEIELAELEQNILKEKNFYLYIEIITVLIIVFCVILLGYIIAKQIHQNSKKLQNLNDDLANSMFDLKRQEKFIRGILDSQPNIVVVSDGEKMVDSNDALVEFFEGYDSFEDFKKKHACICDYFVDLHNDEYIIDKDYGEGKRWYEHILEFPNHIHKVAMYQGHELHYFTITAKKNFLDKENFIVVVSLNDITELIYAQTKLKSLNDNLEGMVNKKTNELKKLNENLEQRIQKEVEINRQRDKQLIQQSRFASMGEMIGNIAHQWRQPLSAISSTVSAMQLQRKINIASEEDVDKSYSDIMKYVDFLTHTIEDFRSFFKQDKKLVNIDILDVMEKTINITHATYKNQRIEIIKEYEDDNLESFGLPNELSQVFLNLLTNSKDALMENKVEKKFVKIRAYTDRHMHVVEVVDNAGGIKKEVMDKIFDPYFTTKHQSQGTGIGLYISKDIIEKHLKGLITVFNETNEFAGEKYTGACFKIALPKI